MTLKEILEQEEDDRDIEPASSRLAGITVQGKYSDVAFLKKSTATGVEPAAAPAAVKGEGAFYIPKRAPVEVGTPTERTVCLDNVGACVTSETLQKLLKQAGFLGIKVREFIC